MRESSPHLQHNPLWVTRREVKGFLSAGVIDDADKLIATIMLLAPKVDFSRDKVESLVGEKETVNQVFDNLEKYKIWDEGKWGFDEDSLRDENHMAVEFILHLLCAKGEIVRVFNSSTEQA